MFWLGPSPPVRRRRQCSPRNSTQPKQPDSKKKETELIAPVNSNQNESKLTTTQTANVTDKITEKKTTCKGEASDKDFLKLRKNMAAKDNDEAMINEAKKLFKTKCLSVEQIRYLSSLFLTSAAKYQFFDAAYKYVSDKNNFVSLQTEIKDEYYLKRFKALIGE